VFFNNKKKSQKITLKKFIDDEYSAWRLANRKNGKNDLRRLSVNFVETFGDVPLKDISFLYLITLNELGRVF